MKLLLLIVIASPILCAQWQANGVAVCDTAPNGAILTFPRIAPDAAGGGYICWRDVRGGDVDVYAQRIDSNGNILWKRNGIPVVRAAVVLLRMSVRVELIIELERKKYIK